MPRPSKLTPERQKVILDGIRAGLPRKFAAARAGIPVQTLNSWLRKGRVSRAASEYRSFHSAFKKAGADFMTANVATIQKAARDGTWQCAAWLLERRYPEYFSSFRGEIAELRRAVRELMAQGGRNATGGAAAGGPNPDPTDPDRDVE